MAPKNQLELLENFQTARPSNSLFCHQDFLEKLDTHSRDAIGRRAAFLMQRLAVDSRRLHYKATQGVNRGWRRSRLGGNHGSHFYAWWAPKNAAPLKDAVEFSSVPDGAVFLRDIRHHDDHSEATRQSFEANYMPVSVRDLRTEEYAPGPWTQPQARFATGRQTVRLLKGHPGSGKTTALWHAADSAAAERILYVTYSRDLAALARDYFDRFCSSHKQFHVLTFPQLVRQALQTDAAVTPESESRALFKRDLAPLGRGLGVWANHPMALYDELHAHLSGDAIPFAIGRFAACNGPRVPDKAYRERRTRSLGPGPVTAALEAAGWLQRNHPEKLADRYFPELALARLALDRLCSDDGPAAAGLLGFDCIAVDECQDLTPVESLLVTELAAANSRGRRVAIPLLMAGDEAQTVRPTDFEWGWLSDLLHARLSAPSEYKLSMNLRSPQRIAQLGNRVWDLYSQVRKQERPSGAGASEVDDDATDQVLYCSAAPGTELVDLLTALSQREGLAVIALEETDPAYVPEALRTSVLTPREAKGLDFHSVCLLDAGRHLERIQHEESRLGSDADIQDLRKRLAIDQFRVAISRPTERLLWLDVNPSDRVIRQSLDFLNGSSWYGHADVRSCVPAALLKTLEEDELEIEERVQRCQMDARQYLDVRPDLAWSRAHQAVTLLGRAGAVAAVSDETARQTAWLTLSEICFTLGFRNARLSPELGHPDLFQEAERAAAMAERYKLSAVISAMGRAHRVSAENRLQALVDLARLLPSAAETEILPWVLTEISGKAKFWVEELESALFNGHNAALLIQLLPPFYASLGLPDRAARTERLQQRAIQLLIKEKQFSSALAALRALPEAQPKLEAACHEGLHDYRSAAASHAAAGNLKEALNCYRSIPDLDAALQLLKDMPEHPAMSSLQWIGQLQRVVADRPEKFTKMVTSAEKKMLEELLERALGVTRRKPAPRSTAKKKSAGAPRKRAARKV